jgi:hypothetical protein
MAVLSMVLMELISVDPTVSYAKDFMPQAKFASCATMPSTWPTLASLLYDCESSHWSARSSSLKGPVFLPVRAIDFV